MAVTLALGRQRQDDHEFLASLATNKEANSGRKLAKAQSHFSLMLLWEYEQYKYF